MMFLRICATAVIHLMMAPQDHVVEAWVVSSPQLSARYASSIYSIQPNLYEETESKHKSFTTKERLDLKILLIDNHDSYTYNLYQYLSTMSLHPVIVVMNDEFSSWEAFMHNLSGVNHAMSTLDHFDCIVISPGPGRPSHTADMGIVLEAIRMNAEVPILGVCLGHQALGYVYGCDVKLAPSGPVHGLMSSVFYNEADGDRFQLFNDVPQNFDVVRYHSLVVEFPDASELDVEPIAWCSDKVSSISDGNEKRLDGSQSFLHSNATAAVCMGLRHKINPHYGVQFHPESIGTAENGYRILSNFCEFAAQYNQKRKTSSEIYTKTLQHNRLGHHLHQKGHLPVMDSKRNENATSSLTVNVDRMNGANTYKTSYKVIVHKIEKDNLFPFPTPEEVFEDLYGSRHNSFWLDSSTGETRIKPNKSDRKSPEVQLDREGCPITTNSRFSIMGSDDGPLSRKVEYFGREHSPEVRGLRVTSGAHGETIEKLDMSILAYLQNQINFDFATFTFGSTNCDISELTELSDDTLPFNFRGGYVGYLGYEVRYDCLDDGCRGNHCTIFEPESTNPLIPTAAFLFTDRNLLYDHMMDDWYVIGVSTDESIDDTVSWMCGVASAILSSSKNETTGKDVTPIVDECYDGYSAPVFTPNRSKEQYLQDLTRSHDEIRRGESYELCVTNQFTTELKLPRLSTKRAHESPLELYKCLRRRNPAPFSSYFTLHPKKISTDYPSAQVSICCSSPERFLSMRKNNSSKDTSDFTIESKPIKGTAARYVESDSINENQLDFIERVDSEIATRLKESVKDRAENLMIVDLLRNDFGRVCKIGSVHVPKLMHIESYATVHQMVSTVRGIVDSSTTNAINVIEACFPGGSMTGAPKHRTVEILDEIEQGVSRGAYSGCLGYISLNGCMDMNIIIRTAVLTPSGGCNDSTETWKISIGCGGAITALSDSNDEYEEMLLKSRAVKTAILEWAQVRQAII